MSNPSIIQFELLSWKQVVGFRQAQLGLRKGKARDKRFHPLPCVGIEKDRDFCFATSFFEVGDNSLPVGNFHALGPASHRSHSDKS